MIQDDEITEAIQALCEEDATQLTALLRRCGNTILKREELKNAIARIVVRNLSRVVLWEHRFSDQSLDMARLLCRALRKGHLRYRIDDQTLALSKKAKTHHTAGQSLIDDAQAMLPPAYVVYAVHDGHTVSVILSPVTSCCVQ